MTNAESTLIRSLMRPRDWIKGSEPKDCGDADHRFGILLVHARVCDSDAECRHYPCTCSAIGSSEAAKELPAIHEFLDKKCKGANIPWDYCGETEPICVDHICAVRKIGEPGVGRAGPSP
jgi:hypothetical protein